MMCLIAKIRRADPFFHSLSAWVMIILFAGCQTTAITDGSSEPSWWRDARTHDAFHLYFRAKGESRESAEGSRQNAVDAIKAQIATYILSSVDVVSDGSSTHLSVRSSLDLREVDIYEESEPDRQDGAWVVYVLGRYPQDEYEKVKQKIEQGQLLDRQWSKAQSLMNRGVLAEAEPLLRQIIGGYDNALNTSFDLEEAKLTLAAVYARQGYSLKARQWAQDVRKSTTEQKWQDRAVRLEDELPPTSLKDCFADVKLGVSAFVVMSGKLVNGTPLLEEAHAQLSRSGIRYSPIGAGAITCTKFDDKLFRQLAMEGRSLGLDAMLLLWLDIDGEKTGKSISIPGGGSAPALDATLRYAVISVSDGITLCADETRGASNGSVDRAAAQLLNLIVNHKRHLPAHALSIVGRFQK